MHLDRNQCDRVQMPSANSRSSRNDFRVHMMVFGSLNAVLLIQSSRIMKRRGEKGQPCLTPVVTLTVPPFITWQVKFSYNNLIMFMIFAGIP